MNVAIITYNNDLNKWTALFNNKIILQSGSKEYIQNRILLQDNNKVRKLKISSYIEENISFTPVPMQEPKKEEFSINERFGFVEKTITMVINKKAPSACITGAPGLGKTHTVLKTLQSHNLTNCRDYKAPEEAEDWQNPGDYILIKGFSTARGLYRSLYENNGKIIIYDDCDNILKSDDALNLLKAALDSYQDRWVSWNSENRNSDLPKSFLFTGQVIFISNKSLADLDMAVRTRALCIDLSMTPEQKIERMETIIANEEFLPEISFEEKLDALNFIDKHKHQVEDLSLRSLIAISKIRAGNEDWQQLAKYVLTNN